MKKTHYVVHTAIIIIVGYSLISATILNNWSTMFVLTLTLILSFLPNILENRYEIVLSKGLRFGILLFLFGTLFLGEVNHYYDTFYWWDAVLHFWAGFGLTLLGFIVLKEIYSQSQLKSVPLLTSIFGFSFSAMLLGLWEVYEYIADKLGLPENKMQPSLEDTMVDLIVGYVAGAIVSVFGYRYLRHREKNFAAKAIEESKLHLNDK